MAMWTLAVVFQVIIHRQLIKPQPSQAQLKKALPKTPQPILLPAH